MGRAVSLGIRLAKVRGFQAGHMVCLVTTARISFVSSRNRKGDNRPEGTRGPEAYSVEEAELGFILGTFGNQKGRAHCKVRVGCSVPVL